MPVARMASRSPGCAGSPAFRTSCTAASRVVPLWTIWPCVPVSSAASRTGLAATMFAVTVLAVPAGVSRTTFRESPAWPAGHRKTVRVLLVKSTGTALPFTWTVVPARLVEPPLESAAGSFGPSHLPVRVAIEPGLQANCEALVMAGSPLPTSMCTVAVALLEAVTAEKVTS